MAAKKSAIFDYGALLDRARSDLPEELSHEGRWAVPELDTITEGRTTIIRNWRDIVTTLRRDPQHVFSFLLRELGTAGDADDDRATLGAKIPDRKINERLDIYVHTYVLCDECESPDTHMEREGRTQILKCDACGAHRPVRVRKRKSSD